MNANNGNSNSTEQEVASTKKMVSYAFGWVLSVHLIVAFDSYIFYSISIPLISDYKVKIFKVYKKKHRMIKDG